MFKHPRSAPVAVPPSYLGPHNRTEDAPNVPVFKVPAKRPRSSGFSMMFAPIIQDVRDMMSGLMSRPPSPADEDDLLPGTVSPQNTDGPDTPLSDRSAVYTPTNKAEPFNHPKRCGRMSPFAYSRFFAETVDEFAKDCPIPADMHSEYVADIHRTELNGESTLRFIRRITPKSKSRGQPFAVEPTVFIAAAIVATRMANCVGERFSNLNKKKMAYISLIIGAKLVTDAPYTNKYWANYSEIYTPEDTNVLEFEFLQTIGPDSLVITEMEFRTFEIMAWAAHETRLKNANTTATVPMARSL